MKHANAKPMICIDCGMRIEASITQAKAHGWCLWVGGARCKRCDESRARDRWGDAMSKTRMPSRTDVVGGGGQ